MTPRTSQLLQDVLALPVDERAAVAAELLDSLDDKEPTDTREVAAAWAEEIERRARRVLSMGRENARSMSRQTARSRSSTP